MDLDQILTGVGGVVGMVISSVVSWLLAKKKYYSEVDATIIENLQKSLDFYIKLSDDNKQRLDETLERNRKLEDEINDLRKQVLNLTTLICTDLNGQLRKKTYDEILSNKTLEDDTSVSEEA